MNTVLIAAPAVQTQKSVTRPTEEGKSTPPFGAVLSGQMAQPAHPGKPHTADKAHAHKATTQQDNRPTAPTADGVSSLPADMLASLMQQGKTVATATTPTADARQVGDNLAPTSTGTEAAAMIALANATPATASTDTGKASIAAPSNSETTTLAIQADTGKTSATTARQSVGETTLSTTQTNTEQPSDSVQRFSGLLESASTAPHKEQALPALAAAAPQVSTPQTNLVATLAPQNVVAPATPLTVTTPVGRKDWGDDFGQKITWLATHNQQSAELHLNPPQLGPLDVVVSVSGDQATAFFSSPHAAVRDAVEQAMPKLREMMADNGITLGNTSVSDQSRENAQDAHKRSGSARTEDISDNMASSHTPSVLKTVPTRRHQGLLDTFA